MKCWESIAQAVSGANSPPKGIHAARFYHIRLAAAHQFRLEFPRMEELTTNELRRNEFKKRCGSGILTKFDPAPHVPPSLIQLLSSKSIQRPQSARYFITRAKRIRQH
jgi:hypothetical protein